MSTQDQSQGGNGGDAGGKGPLLVMALGAVVVVVALVLMMQTENPAGGSEDHAKQTSTPAPTGETKPDDKATGETPKTADNGSGDAPKTGGETATPTTDKELAPLPLVLPDPAFAGTPKEVPKGINIDKKRLGKKRPPFMAPKGVKNVAADKKATSSDPNPIIGDLDLVTDGDKEALDGSYVELTFGKQWVQVDLEKEYEIYAIVFWHRHVDPHIYRDVIVQVSNDPKFEKDVTTVFNNDNDNSMGMGAGKNYEYFESDEGELVPVKGLKARYVRLWSNGNTSDDQNHYTEVEVWALPN